MAWRGWARADGGWDAVFPLLWLVGALGPVRARGAASDEGGDVESVEKGDGAAREDSEARWARRCVVAWVALCGLVGFAALVAAIVVRVHRG